MLDGFTISLRSVAAHERDHKGNQELAALLDCAADEIDRLAAQQDAAWQPIETAPKDRFIFLHCEEDDSTWLAKWQGGVWYGVDAEHGLTREGHSAGDTNYMTGWFVNSWRDVPKRPAGVEQSSGRSDGKD